MLWDHNPFRGNSNYWQDSQVDNRQIIPKRQLRDERGIII
jgi:hypothetical protein